VVTASSHGAGVTLAIDPQNPRRLYAGATDGGGVRKSLDGGRTWKPSNAGLASLHVTAIAVDPVNPDTLYAATARGVFVSIDGGETWDARNAGLSDVRVFALAINPRSPGTVYAGGFGGRVYTTLDRGEHWTEVRVGPPVYRVAALLADAGGSSDPALDNQGPALYAGTSGGGAFRSEDGGATWSPLASLESATIYALTLDPRVPHTLYAGTAEGLYKSLDRGERWTLLDHAPRSAILALAIDPSDSRVLYAGTPDGVARTADGGRRWAAVSAADPPGAIVSLIVDPWNSRTVYAARFGGEMFRSDDGGARWGGGPTGGMVR
jgi:photosystem II stability/assembly factor-like uncharacterized protein